MSGERLLIPLLNKKVITFNVPVLYLDDNVYLSTISDEDFGALHRALSGKQEEYLAQININTKCIHIANPDYTDLVEYSESTATKLKFLFNSFALDTPIVINWLSLLSFGRKVKMEKLIDVEVDPYSINIRKKNYKVKTGQKKENLSEYYKIIDEVGNKNKKILFTIERYNSCIVRPNFLDKIVDATISLESLIPGRQELRYRFALYLSFIYANDPEKRYQVFDDLLKLYDVRSSIVHGDVEGKKTAKKIEYINENWDKMLGICIGSLTYFLMYLHQNDLKEWDTHLMKLVFGLENRIID